MSVDEQQEREDQQEQVEILSVARATLLATRADARSRQALTKVADLGRASWSREQHQEFDRRMTADRERDSRWVRRMVVLTTLVVVVSTVVFLLLLQQEQGRRARVDAELLRIQQAAITSCNARNDQLETQRLVYMSLAEIEQLPDSVQSEVVATARQEAYELAAANLPDPVDCAIYERSDLAISEPGQVPPSPFRD